MREFFKWMAASALGTLVGLVTFTALVGIGAGSLLFLIIASTSRETETTLEPNSMLVLDLATDIRDSIPPSGAGIVFGDTLAGTTTQSISVYQALNAIQQAATDDDISGLFIYGNSDSGFATLWELRQALTDFQESGKPIVAYEVGWSERDYYITSLADTLVLDTTGILELNGFQAETQFLAGALEKYGVGVQVLQAGRYKSAVEPFTRSDNSPEDRAQTEALLASLWQEFLTVVAESRDSTPTDLQQLADAGGILMATEAETAKLVDRVAYYEDVLTDLQALTESDADLGEDIPAIDLVSYSHTVSSDHGRSRDVVAVLYAEGEIILGEGGMGVIGSDSLSRSLRDLRLDDDIKAVVLRINSPGGSATASEIITDAVKRLQAEKPVIVSMGNLAASGGYMMAAAGERIYAAPNTITGSIGVFGLILNLQELANRNGITWDVVKTARFADMGTIARPQSPEELALQQAVVTQLYDRFVTLVAEGRDLTKARVESVAQGRVWAGNDALQAGLVDEIGGIEAAIAAAAEAAELDTWRVQEYPQPRTLSDEIFERLFGNVVSRLQGQRTHPVLMELQRAQAQWTLLESLSDPHGIYTRLPFNTEIE
ncbi:signal peptide peptidase SppA [Leptolyngbya sp. PCC 6406]|uniref:signal peptide peptidase SppA n=1 Tax=Leptolyngbya sp. PCC 6406 TaxID=1173264 RepID=UPI0002AC432D|nr:signal peptide peptidase SppA [Leptolyngbya sp. PCC 6406]